MLLTVRPCGVQMWQRVFNQVFTSLVIFQIVMVFIFAIKKLIWAPIITAPLLIISAIFFQSVRRRFRLPQTILSFRGATDADHRDEVKMLLGLSRALACML